MQGNLTFHGGLEGSSMDGFLGAIAAVLASHLFDFFFFIFFFFFFFFLAT